MIRNSEGKWLDSLVFSKEAIQFYKNKNFISSPQGTPDWFTYWEEQLNRCTNGYMVGGEKITGNHYMYLNFTQIQIVETIENSKASRKIQKNPDFWDGDFDYFWVLEIAKNGVLGKFSQAREFLTEEEEMAVTENLLDKKGLDKLKASILYDRLKLKIKIHPDYLDGGYHLVVGKSRRKGYSYKNGAICANIYNTVRDAQIIIGAFEKKFLYPKGTMGMTSDYLDFLNEHTGWSKSRDAVNKQDHKKASYKTKINGVEVEKGYKSEVFALSFRDNPDAARGKDAKLVLLEEAGAFPNLKDAFSAITPALTAGKYITGQVIIFGTGGDMEKGTIDYADMFYNPEIYGMLPIINTWDEDAENSTCGFFHPVTWNMEGHYDEQGNSNIETATEFEMGRRKEILEKSSSSLTLQKHIQEFPFCPSEAFLTVSTNNFPVVELRRQLNKVQHEGLQLKKGTPVTIIRKDGVLKAKPDLQNKLQPIIHYKPKVDDISGAPIIYEYPIDDPPKGLYKIGYDPYRQDLSAGVSLASIYVYKSSHKFSYHRNMIVAEYVGRPQEADDVNRIASQLAELYNAEIMHENEVTHVKNYFRRHKKLHQLAVQPEAVISKSIRNSTVARIYGIHMPEQLKDDGEKYIKDWLLTVRDYDENGNPILNLETIYSIGLLEELIQYNKKGNFDRVMAFMMCMFQTQEDELEKEYGKDDNERLKSIINMMDKFYKKD